MAEVRTRRNVTVDPETLVRVYQKASSSAEAAKELDISVASLFSRIGRLRKAGVKNLKSFPKVGRPSRLNIDELNALAEKLTTEPKAGSSDSSTATRMLRF